MALAICSVAVPADADQHCQTTRTNGQVLGGILLSRIAQAFIEAYCVRMAGGTLRFQAQYLKRIRVPQQDQISAATKDALRAAFRSRYVDAATLAAGAAYGIEPKDYDLA